MTAVGELLSLQNPQPLVGRRVAIILVNWNGWRECIECIDSLLAQRHQNFHVFVVDNDSTDSSIDNILAWCAAPKADDAWRRHPGVARLTDAPTIGVLRCQLVERGGRVWRAPEKCHLTLVRSAENLGFAAGCNVGINVAGVSHFDCFWFLNPDTVVAQNALVELLARMGKQPDIGMVGSTLRYYDRPDIVQSMGGGRLNRSNGTSALIGQGTCVDDIPADESTVEHEMTYVMGASMLVSARFITTVGLMEEDYFLYFEEIDWALRGRGRFKLGFAPRSHVFHKSGANSSKARPLYTSGFYYRNRLRFVARFLPDRLAAAKRSLFVEMLRHMARGRVAHVRLLLSTLLAANRIIAAVIRRS